MAYNKQDLFEQAKQAIKENRLHFIEDVVANMPCTKSTFYKHLPIDSNELNELKELIAKNAINLKNELRKKWKDSDNATLQISLYKLLADDNERKRLAQTFMDHTSNGESLGIQIKYVDSENKND